MGLDLTHGSPADEGLEYITVNELIGIPGYFEKHKHLLKEIEVENEENNLTTEQVLYYLEKGYQRKGMNERFYKDFENCKLYFDLVSVIKASQYLTTLGPEHDINVLTKNFQDNFIDNFVEGESFFFASW